MYLSFALLAALLWTLVNYLDKYLIDWVTEDSQVGPLVMFSGLIGIPVIILLFFLSIVSGSNLISGLGITQIFTLVFTGIVYLLGVIPYLYALNNDEASAVVPQMLLTPVIGFIFAYLLLGETLNSAQILGCLYIIWGAISINFHKPKSYKEALKVFMLMTLFSLSQATNSTLFKFVAVEEISYLSLFFFEYLGFSIFFFFTFIFIKKYRDQFIRLLKTAGLKVFTINMVGEGTTVLGNSLFHISTLFIPVALAHFVAEGTQPLIAIFLGILLTKNTKVLLNEDISFTNLSKKILSITVILVGLGIVITST